MKLSGRVEIAGSHEGNPGSKLGIDQTWGEDRPKKQRMGSTILKDKEVNVNVASKKRWS